MLKVIFSLLVSVACFFVGVSIVFIWLHFYRQPITSSLVDQFIINLERSELKLPQEKIEPVILRNVYSEAIRDEKLSLSRICLSQKITQNEELNEEEQAAFLVLKPTIKRWLKGRTIKNEFTEASSESIKEILGKDKSQLTEDEARWFSYFRFEPTLIDINGDGRNELAVRNYCAPVGNCQFWLFKKNSKGYKTILRTEGGAVQTFKLKRSKTNGHFDLETRNHGDAWSGEITLYKFNGKEYTTRECSTYSYSYLKDGKLAELKRPKITQIKCSE